MPYNPPPINPTPVSLVRTFAPPSVAVSASAPVVLVGQLWPRPS